MSHDPDADDAVPAAVPTEDSPAPRPRRRRAPAKVAAANDAMGGESAEAAAPDGEAAPSAPAESVEANDGAPAETGEAGEAGAASQRPRRKRRRGRKGKEGREAREGGAAAPLIEGALRPPMPDAGELFAIVQDGSFDNDDAPSTLEPPADEVIDAPAPTPASEEEGAAADAAPERRILAPDAEAPKLQKVLAQSGVGSRRDLEQMIVDGRVSVNGEVAHVGQRVSWGDQVAIDGKPVRVRIAPLPTRVLAYHKPVGEVVTVDDPEGRPTVFRRLPRLLHGKWQSVGRLDINTEGLLLFTTSGELANRLMHPRFGIEREYAVRVLGTLTDEQRARVLAGVPIEGQTAAFLSCEDGGGEGANHWYRVKIAEGRNREVRRLFDAVGLAVSRLIRIRYGTVVLPRGLKRGAAVDLSPDDVKLLRVMTGLGEGRGNNPRQRGGEPQRDQRDQREGRNKPGRGGEAREGPREPRPPQARREPREPREARPPREAREPSQPLSHEAHVIVKKRRGGKYNLHEGFGDAALKAREHEFKDHHDDVAAEPADFTNIPNPLQQTFDQRAIREERKKRDIGDDAPIPNPLQQTFDQRALKAAARAPQRELDDDAPIPNPLQQTYDKRQHKGPPKNLGAGGNGGPGGSQRGRGKKRGGGGGAKAGGAQPDPMRTAVGYIGGDAFLNKKGGGGGGRRRGGSGGGGGGGGSRGGTGRGGPRQGR
jgi:23S rRNA pseudouridine2605 synthase